MKKRISMLLALVFVFFVLFIPVQAADTAGVAVSGTISLDDLDSNPDVIVSDPMTFTEMIARMAKNADMSYDEVLRMLPDTMQTQAARSNAYRSFTARLHVTDEYKPYLDFYCATSEGGHFFNINSIYSIQLVQSYNGISKQFGGEVNAWLRSSNSIEYYVNGDFFNNGTTTVSGGIGVNAGLNVKCSATYSVSYSSNHYKYFYVHKTIKYGS